MVPFFGPSTVRDGLGSGVDVFTNPVRYVDDTAVRYGLAGLDLIDSRARRLPLDDTLEPGLRQVHVHQERLPAAARIRGEGRQRAGADVRR